MSFILINLPSLSNLYEFFSDPVLEMQINLRNFRETGDSDFFVQQWQPRQSHLGFSDPFHKDRLVRLS